MADAKEGGKGEAFAKGLPKRKSRGQEVVEGVDVPNIQGLQQRMRSCMIWDQEEAPEYRINGEELLNYAQKLTTFASAEWDVPVSGPAICRAKQEQQ